MARNLGYASAAAPWVLFRQNTKNQADSTGPTPVSSPLPPSPASLIQEVHDRRKEVIFACAVVGQFINDVHP